MSKRFGVLAMLAVVAVVGGAAILAQAGTDPAELDCGGGYRSIGFSQPSTDSLYPTPTEAAAAFLEDMAEIEGKPIPVDVELVDLTGAGDAGASGREIAARVDGATIAVLSVSQVDGGWAVQRDIAC